MAIDEEWFLDRGFRVEVERAGADLYWTHLVCEGNPNLRVPNYGSGTTAEDSIARAKQRFKVEQLGEDSAR
jgi:hypothetical protein